MKSPNQPSEPNGEQNLTQEFDREILSIERSLLAVKESYTQMLADKQRQIELTQRFENIEHQQRQTPSTHLKAELKSIKQQLLALDNALGLLSESYLVLFGGSVVFTKSGLQDVFWQVVRFGGMGVIIGWLLKSVTS